MSPASSNRRDHQLRDVYLMTTLVADNARYELEGICQGFGLTIAQYPILWTLCLSGERGGLPMSELADGLLTRASDTTRLVGRLVENGLVVRTSVATDRRKVVIEVTPKGRKAFTAVTEKIKAGHRRQFAALTEGEVEQLLALMSKIDWSQE